MESQDTNIKSVDQRDVAEARMCGHKLDNAVRKISAKLRTKPLSSLTWEEMAELLDVAYDTAYHVKWMTKILRQLE
jgi:hypothetical protein